MKMQGYEVKAISMKQKMQRDRELLHWGMHEERINKLNGPIIKQICRCMKIKLWGCTK